VADSESVPAAKASKLENVDSVASELPLEERLAFIHLAVYY